MQSETGGSGDRAGAQKGWGPVGSLARPLLAPVGTLSLSCSREGHPVSRGGPFVPRPRDRQEGGMERQFRKERLEAGWPGKSLLPTLGQARPAPANPGPWFGLTACQLGSWGTLGWGGGSQEMEASSQEMGTAAPQRTLGLHPRQPTRPSCFGGAVPGHSKNQPEQISLG